jgi:hypothetical protein
MALQTLTAYDQLLAEAVRLQKKHETRAKDFVPRMYEVLVEGEGLVPQDAADRIYMDLVGIWEKDTIRRLLPDEVKNQSARERQKQSRSHMVGKAGLILQNDGKDATERIVQLQRQNAQLSDMMEALQKERNELLEKTLRLERMLAVQRELHDPVRNGHMPGDKRSAVVMPPNLFMKAFTLMRNSTKPLVLKIAADEVVDVEKINV